MVQECFGCCTQTLQWLVALGHWFSCFLPGSDVCPLFHLCIFFCCPLLGHVLWYCLLVFCNALALWWSDWVHRPVSVFVLFIMGVRCVSWVPFCKSVPFQVSSQLISVNPLGFSWVCSFPSGFLPVFLRLSVQCLCCCSFTQTIREFLFPNGFFLLPTRLMASSHVCVLGVSCVLDVWCGAGSA